jgi:dTDP-4-dehydrorhamnose reductase
LDLQPHSLVIRTSAVFGDRGSAIKGGSFPDRILMRAEVGEPLRVVTDQKVNPTYAADLARVALELADSGLEGLVHVVAAGCAGWNDFARAVLAEFHLAAGVEAVTSADLGAPAPRPLNGCLASDRVAPMRPWREGLHDWAVRRSGAANSP